MINLHPRTGHEGPERMQGYSSALSLISALDENEWSLPCPGHCTPCKEIIMQEAGWAPGTVWTGAENFVSIRI